MAVARERRQLAASGLAWIGHDDVERIVREGSLGVAQRAFHATAQRAALLMDHRYDGRDATRDRGAAAVLEVIERRPRRCRREMRVQVDAAREHEEAARVDVAIRRRGAADGGDPLA